MARADSNVAALVEETEETVEDAEKMSAKTSKKATKKTSKKAARKAPMAATKSKSAVATKSKSAAATKSKSAVATKSKSASKGKTSKAKKSSTAPTTKRATARTRKSNGRAKLSIAASAWNRHEIPAQQQFFLCSGQRLRNIEELADVLDEMQKEIFEYHVNNERNDIHAWVKDVFHEDALADDLLGAGNAHQMRDIIRQYAPEGA